MGEAAELIETGGELVVPEPPEDLRESEVNALVEAADSFLVRTDDEYTDALLFERDALKPRRKRLVEFWQNIERPFRQALKNVSSQRKQSLEPLDAAIAIIEQRTQSWRRERERERERVLAEEREKAQLEAEARRLAAAEALEAAGNEDAAQALLDSPVVPLPPVVPPAVPVVEKVHTQTRWAAEVVDLPALILWVAENPVERQAYLMPNGPLLNQVARDLREQFAIPGVRAIKKETTVAR